MEKAWVFIKGKAVQWETENYCIFDDGTELFAACLRVP